MSLNLKELRKLAVISYGYYAVLLDNSTAFIGDKPPTAEVMREYKVLYHIDEEGWKKWNQNTWKDIESQPTDLDLSGTNNPPAKKPTAPKSSAVIDQKYRDMKLSDQAAPGNVGYDYQTSLDGKSLQYKTKASSGPWKTLGQSYSKWDDVVTAINALGKKTSDETVPAGQAANAPETEAAKPAAPAAAVSSLDPTLVANVRAILMRVQSEALAVSTAQNEKGRVKEIIAGISEEIGQNINATDFLAQLIVARRGQQLSALGLGDIDTKIIPNTNKKEFTFNRPLGKPGVYAQPTSAILQEVNLIYDAFKKYVKSGETEFFKSINHTVTPAQPPAAPATTAPTTSSIKYPAKIIRLASLRRLRVRSEMEAAITGSAMPGRDRVV